MKPWAPETDRASCVRQLGHMRQLCGLTRYTFSEGKARGVEAVDFDTGGGLRFSLLPGRGMDIGALSYRGVPVAYIAKPGITAPGYHDPRESQWLKSFFAGMLTTCGLTNAGPACRDRIGLIGETPFGLHGDISNTGAENVCTREEWVEGRYLLEARGRVEEGRLHGEHLQLKRRVHTFLGEKRLFVEDVFENLGESPQPLMFFYHINVGYPLLGPAATFEAPSKRVWAQSPQALCGLSRYEKCGPPQPGCLEEQFFHQMGADEKGETLCAVVNEELELAVYLRYNVKELPCMAQWKVLREGEYVLAFEPGNCHPIGRDKQRQKGFALLESMGAYQVRLEIGLADGAGEIAALRAQIKSRR